MAVVVVDVVVRRVWGPSPQGVLMLAMLLVPGVGCSQQDPGAGGSGGSSGSAAVGGGAGVGGAAGAGAGGAGVGGGPGDVSMQFYPLIDGASWTYRHTGGAQDWTEEVSMSDVVHQGRSGFLLSDTPGPNGSSSDSVLTREGTRAQRIHKEVKQNGAVIQVVDYDPGFVRFDEAWASLAPGTEVALNYLRTEQTPTGPVEVTRTQQYTIESTDDSVTVPAGSFTGCVRVHRLRSDVDPTMAASEKRFWFCAGVGKVKEDDLLDGDGEELVSCSVPGGGC